MGLAHAVRSPTIDVVAMQILSNRSSRSRSAGERQKERVNSALYSRDRFP